MSRWPSPVTDEDVLAFMERFSEAHEYMPSVREIAAGVGLGSTAAQWHLDRLVKAGRVRRTPGKSRTTVVVK